MDALKSFKRSVNGMMDTDLEEMKSLIHGLLLVIFIVTAFRRLIGSLPEIIVLLGKSSVMGQKKYMKICSCCYREGRYPPMWIRL